MAYRNYSTAVSHIVDSTGLGDFTTIGAALAAASSGDIIFVRQGTYTENITGKAGVVITGFSGQNGNNTELVGRINFSGTGRFTVANLNLTTNSDFSLNVFGSAASDLRIHSCFISGANTLINLSSSNSSSAIFVEDCTLSLSDTGIAFFTCTGAGAIVFLDTTGDNAPLSPLLLQLVRD